MTESGSKAIIVKQRGVEFVIVPVFRDDSMVDTETMARTFAQVLFNLECEYSNQD